MQLVQMQNPKEKMWDEICNEEVGTCPKCNSKNVIVEGVPRKRNNLRLHCRHCHWIENDDE
jgi:hypothetical protein